MKSTPDAVIEIMKEVGIPVNRKNYLEMIFNGDVPDPVPAEIEAQLPEELQRISDMKDHYRRWLDARAKWRREGGDALKPSEAIATELRNATVAMLRLVAKGKKKLPGDVAHELADAMEYLAAGQDESFLLPGKVRLSKRKRPLQHPFLLALRLDAVRYLNAVAQGKIKDDRPKHTVALAYGVHRTTVLRWQKQYPDIECEGGVRVLEMFMKASGKHYRKQMKRRFQKTQ